MTLYVAYLGVQYETGAPLGVYDSIEAAVEAVRQYVNKDGMWELDENHYYEVYSYELNAVSLSEQFPVASGAWADLQEGGK